MNKRYFLTIAGLVVWIVLWAIGGLLAICGALSQAELSALLPKSGGDYVFLHEAYGPLSAFLSGWVSFLIGFAGPIAVLSDASVTYLLTPLHLRGDAAWLAIPRTRLNMLVSIGAPCRPALRLKSLRRRNCGLHALHRDAARRRDRAAGRGAFVSLALDFR